MSDDARKRATDRREQAAESIASILSRHNLTSDVNQDGDRVSLRVGEDYVTLVVVQANPPVADGVTSCPYCGSTNLLEKALANLLTPREDSASTCDPRRGCLDCDQYFEPVRLKRRR